MQYIDLTHLFKQNGMPAYHGDPESELKQVSFIGEDDCNSFEVKTGLHVGTHVDAPAHMLQNGKWLDEYPVDRFFGNGVVIDARDRETIGIESLAAKEISKGDIVLILTGFSAKFEEPEYYLSYPVMTEEFAEKMVEFGVKMVGMDTPSPDKSPYSIHKILLGNDVLIIENLTNLESLLTFPRFEVIALPVRFEAEAAPIRVVARFAISTPFI